MQTWNCLGSLTRYAQESFVILYNIFSSFYFTFFNVGMGISNIHPTKKLNDNHEDMHSDWSHATFVFVFVFVFFKCVFQNFLFFQNNNLPEQYWCVLNPFLFLIFCSFSLYGIALFRFMMFTVILFSNFSTFNSPGWLSMAIWFQVCFLQH